MSERRDPAPKRPCICGSRDHPPLREAAVDEVGFLRCPERELPRYAARGLEVLSRGLCWAANPHNGLHCTREPHGRDVDHWNAYSGGPWPTEAIPSG